MNKCNKHKCNLCYDEHIDHKGPIEDTGLGHTICKSCNQVIHIYAPL